MARTILISPGTPGCSQPLGCCPEPEDNTPDGRPIITYCTYFNVVLSDVGELYIVKLPIDGRGLCGACENNTNPSIVNLWRVNNPDKVFTEILTVPAITAALRAQLINKRSIMLVDSRTFWEPTIKFRDKFYTVHSTGNTPWRYMPPTVCLSGKHALEGFIHRKSIMQGETEWGWPKYMCIDASGSVNDKCPEFGFMPWWQSPGVKSSADVGAGGYPCNCTIKPTPSDTYGCGLLYENSEVVQNDISKEFLEVFQKWIDDNKDYPEFVREMHIGTDDEIVIALYGFIKKNNEDEPEVTLELRRINPDTFQLERIPEALVENQYHVNRYFMYLVNYAVPKIVCGNNYLLTYDMNSCDFTESLVTERPNIFIPEIITVQYIPCVDEILSVSNPTEYSRIVKNFLMMRYQKQKSTDVGINDSCVRGCCVLTVDELGMQRPTCLNVPEILCNPESIESLINAGYGSDVELTWIDPNPRRNFTRVLETFVATSGTLCTTIDDPTDLNCSTVWDIPTFPTTRPGTCCYIQEDGEWGCIVNNKEQCQFLNGFFQPAFSDGLGGYNPPSCTQGGVASVPLDDSTSVTVMLEGRNCDLNEKPQPTPNPDDPNVKGSCCSIVNWSDIYYKDNNDMTNLSSLVTGATVNLPGYGGCSDLPTPGIGVEDLMGVRLSLLNNGSIIKLSFESNFLMNYIYNTDAIINNPSSTLALKLISIIESNFSIFANNSTAPYTVEFKKIEGNSIFLTVI